MGGETGPDRSHWFRPPGRGSDLPILKKPIRVMVYSRSGKSRLEARAGKSPE